VFMFIIFLTLEAEVEHIPCCEISRASLADEHRLTLLQKAIPARVTEHVGFLNQLFAVYRWLIGYWDFLSVELMQMLLVLAVALLTEAEVVAGYAVEAILTATNRLLASIASEPSLVSSSGLLTFNLLG
jgi:hypothetical protein